MIRLAAGLLVVLSALPVQAGWWGHRAKLPACEAAEVISRITERFAWAETNTWHRGFFIDDVRNIRQTSVKDEGPSHIDRRYCRSTAELSNGNRSELVYLIEAGQGFASIGWRVEFCLPSYDPYRVYDAWCRAIRP